MLNLFSYFFVVFAYLVSPASRFEFNLLVFPEASGAHRGNSVTSVILDPKGGGEEQEEEPLIESGSPWLPESALVWMGVSFASPYPATHFLPHRPELLGVIAKVIRRHPIVEPLTSLGPWEVWRVPSVSF